MAQFTQNLLVRNLVLASLTSTLALAYVVQLNVVVDDLAMKRWKENSGKSTNQELMDELDSILVEVNQLYSTLKDRYSIAVEFRIQNLTMGAQNVVSSPYGEIGTEGLGQFRKWMFEGKKYEKGDWDIALLLTGNDVVGDTRSLLGFGQIDRVCSSWGVAMVEFLSEDYRDAFVIAHELGHVLGANHDGFRDIPDQYCDPKEGYIMTPNTDPRNINHFRFSYCSYYYFYTSLVSGHWDCLSNDGNATNRITGKRLGEIEGADETCQREFDKDAFLNRAEYFTYGDYVCTSLICNNGGGVVKRVFTPQGLHCGKNKQCIHGKCVETPAGKSDVSDDCPFGNSPKIDYKGYKACDDLPLEYCGVMKDECCKRCGGVVGLRDADKACKKLLSNDQAMLLRVKYPYYGDGVCRSLACTTGLDDHGKVTLRWNTPPGGMACGKGKRCQGGKCLPTKINPPDIPDYCAFGNQAWDWWTCRDLIEKDPHYCVDPSYRRRCCASCRYL